MEMNYLRYVMIVQYAQFVKRSYKLILKSKLFISLINIF